MKSETKFNFCH